MAREKISDYNLTELIPLWRTALEERGRSPLTVRAYVGTLKEFARWYTDSFGEAATPAGILPRDVENYKSYLQTVRQAAPRTINRKLAALSRFCKWAVREDLAHGDATADVPGVSLPRLRPQALAPREVHRLRRALAEEGDPRDQALVTVLLETGLRVSELLALRRSDVEIRPRSGSLTVRRGKRGHARRVPLVSEARKALDAYIQDLPGSGNGAALWVGQRGPLTSPSGVNRILDKYAQRAGIEDLHPHKLRHTFAMRYLEAHPGDLRGLAAILGHSNLNTVMIYTVPSEADLLRRMEQMN